MKKLLLLTSLCITSLFSMNSSELDEDQKALREMIFTAAANGKANWIHTLAGFHGTRELIDNAVNEQGATPLLIACQKGHANVVAVLQAEGAEGTKPLEIKTPDGRIIPCTALHMAAGCGHAEIVKLLLESLSESDRSKINSNCDPRGRTPLHCATVSYRWDAAEVLLQYGADRNQKDDDGTTPSMLAEGEPYIYYKLFNGTPSLIGAGKSVLSLINWIRFAIKIGTSFASDGK